MTEIYYFSGTGNCLTVAKAIARHTGGRLIPMASLAGQDTIKPDGDVIGLVFPVYYSQLPVAVKSFLAQLSDISGRYVFAVCTFGGAAGRSLRQTRRLLASRGGALDTAFAVPMPQNAFFKPKENRPRLFERSEEAAHRISIRVSKRQKGTFYNNLLIEFMMLCMHLLILRLCRKKFALLSGMPIHAGFDELVQNSDRCFRTNDSCTRCGLCVKLCPVQNIRMTDAGPEWLHRCTHCLACYNGCPSRAIEGDIAHKGYYYHHPEIKAAEIMAQQPR